jgi:hypothetical protein
MDELFQPLLPASLAVKPKKPRRNPGGTNRAARLKPLLEDRILAGVVLIEKENAAFEVWAYRKFSDEEMLGEWAAYNRQRDRRKSLRGQTIRVVSNYGRELR